MSQLATLQREFRDYVLWHNPAIVGKVTGTARVDASTRLEIYANA